MIHDIFKVHKTISFWRYSTQISFGHDVGGTEMVLLIAMAFGRYAAICQPLHYLTNKTRMCLYFLVTSWVIGFICSLAQLISGRFAFCDPNVLDSFYCDLPWLLRLAWINTQELEFIVTVNNGLISVGFFVLLVITYIFILFTVWKHSSGGSFKAL